MKKKIRPLIVLLLCVTVASSCSKDNIDVQPNENINAQSTLVAKGTETSTIHAIQFSTEGLHSLVLTASGEVYGTGELSYGEMGFGFQKDFEITYKGGVTNNYYAHNFKKLTDPLAINIKKIAVGKNSSYLLSNDGSLYAAGDGGDGQLGSGTLKDNTAFTKVNFNGGTIKEIVGGNFNAFILTTSGKVFAAGFNDYGQLGMGDDENHINFVAVRSLDGYQIAEISCGGNHTLVRTTDGKLLASGSDQYGQLGGKGKKFKFTEIKLPTGVAAADLTQVTAGRESSFILTRSGVLYAAGKNEEGQLGIGSNGDTNKKGFVKVTSVTRVKLIRSYLGHSVALTTSGQLYVTGDNESGQLGLGDNINRNTFQHVTLQGNTISGITEGVESNSTIVITTQGDFFGTGRNRFGNLGLGHHNDINLFQKMPINVKQ
ncbi:RCC1 domain-containing protein [Pedobacter caeni]|uniref:Alpha-tubulin suppressor n=1 Tax=Pedobacter caeni TaxID=288992 RepID=A0A1M5C109_9SPHI|nr:hypothetical protein [Pedobacter caeni]SHF48132.1 Alpha-tubulin suppressor [Pedobacter caeni]